MIIVRNTEGRRIGAVQSLPDGTYQSTCDWASITIGPFASYRDAARFARYGLARLSQGSFVADRRPWHGMEILRQKAPMPRL